MNMTRKRQSRRAAWIKDLTLLAEEIRDAQTNLSNQKIYASELSSALKRNKHNHAKEVISVSGNMKLTNQSKRDAELSRRMFNDPQRDAFDRDLKKINRAMADLAIEIEYNRSILQIKLASVAEGVW